MTVSINGTSGIVNDATDLNYTGTLTGGTGVVNLGSGQVYKDASGNVGIGTTSPASKLSVAVSSSNTDTANAIRIYDVGGTNGNNYGIGFFNDTGRFAYTAGTGGFHAWYTANTERARIDSSGNVLFGTTGIPDGTSIYGSGFIPNNSGRMILRFGTSATATNQLISFHNPNGQVGNIASSGSSTTYVTSSDYRLKENIQPMQNALGVVAQLKPVTYKWKVDGTAGQGFIAHELAEIVPDCVQGEKDAVDEEGNPQYQGIDTSFLVATLTAAIQEQQTLITALTARITALEAPIV